MTLRCFMWTGWRKGSVPSGFAEALSGRLAPLCNLTDPVLLWNTFKHESLDGAQESIGECLSDKIFLTGTTGSHRSLLHSSSDRVSQFASFPSAQDTGQFIRSLAEIIYWKISCPPKPYESWNPSPPHRWLQSTQKVARSSQILLGCRAVGVLSSIVWVVQGWSTREIEIGVRK